METTITGIVYLDMLQQFLIPQLDEDNQEGRIHSLFEAASKQASSSLLLAFASMVI
jgi:hypothetical protein